MINSSSKELLGSFSDRLDFYILFHPWHIRPYVRHCKARCMLPTGMFEIVVIQNRTGERPPFAWSCRVKKAFLKVRLKGPGNPVRHNDVESPDMCVSPQTLAGLQNGLWEDDTFYSLYEHSRGTKATRAYSPGSQLSNEAISESLKWILTKLTENLTLCMCF